MDLNTFLNRLQSFIAHPMIRFIIVPIMYLSYGIAYGAKFGRINYLGTFVLMIFIILLQLLEQFFFINLMKKGYIKWDNATVIIGVLGGLALLMWPMTNTIYFILLIAYLLSIVMMYGVFRLKGSVYYLILQVFLKAFVLTVLSAFMQVNFISIQLLIEAVPILLSTLFYFSELETLDNIKYGTSLKSSYLKYATLSGVFGLIISVIVIKSAALSNLIPVILLGIVVLVTFFRIIKNNRFIAVDKSKNITAFLYAIMLLIYSLI